MWLFSRLPSDRSTRFKCSGKQQHLDQSRAVHHLSLVGVATQDIPYFLFRCSVFRILQVSVPMSPQGLIPLFVFTALCCSCVHCSCVHYTMLFLCYCWVSIMTTHVCFVYGVNTKQTWGVQQFSARFWGAVWTRYKCEYGSRGRTPILKSVVK